MCLAKEIESCNAGEEITPSILYCMAVCDYKQGHYEQSLSHLDGALHINWQVFNKFIICTFCSLETVL